MVTRGNNVFFKSKSITPINSSRPGIPNDLILYALLARLTLTDNRIIEFETKFNQKTQTIELQIDNADLKFFDLLLGMKQGPKFRAFIDWLMGSRRFGYESDPDFISASAMSIWYGATESVINNTPMILFPTADPSHVGYNVKLADDVGKVKFVMLWQYVCGGGGELVLRVNASIVSTLTSPTDIVEDVVISTVGLSPGDFVETDLIEIDVPVGSVVGLSILRNFEGSSDPHSEMIGLLGVRLVHG